MKDEFYASYLRMLAEDEGLRRSGTKEELIVRLVRDGGLTVFDFLWECDSSNYADLQEKYDIPISIYETNKHTMMDWIVKNLLEFAGDELDIKARGPEKAEDWWPKIRM